jgi:Cu+-exporting ATPase
VHDRLERASARGRTPVLVASGGEAIGIIEVADRPREGGKDALQMLRRQGVAYIVMLTGDSRSTATRIAEELGVDEVRADLLPDDKVKAVDELRGRFGSVAMVGDGVNDAPALAGADLGLAIGTGTDVAIEASDLTLVSGDLRAAVDAIRLARRTLATIRGNLFWAFAYNVAAIPLAVAGLLDPMIAAAAMAGSSLFVVGNSLRLRRFRSVREGGAV